MALQGMGVSTFWGFTPAIDLQNAPPAARSAGKWKAADGGGGAPLRVLVAGEGDVRNILRTIAQHRRHPARKLEFYVVEKQLELTAPALQKAINHCSSLQCSALSCNHVSWLTNCLRAPT